MRGTPDPTLPFTVRDAFPALTFGQPVALRTLPGTNRLVVAQLQGKLWSFPADAKSKELEPFGDIFEEQLTPLNFGINKIDGIHAVNFWDFTFHPNFKKNRQIYVCYIGIGQQPRSTVSRFLVSRESPPRIVPGSEQVVYRWGAGGHHGGCVRFGPDGNLYITTGDGSGPNPPDSVQGSQDISNVLGSILRIDVDRPDPGRTYSIPDDNPFVDIPWARPEIYAYGFRQAWRMAIHPETGQVWTADVGWETWEMVCRVQPGENYGWSIVEGPTSLLPDRIHGPTPIATHARSHPRAEAGSITGGPIYRGEKFPELRDAYVYGDWVTGKIWAIRHESDGSYWHQELADTDLQIADFHEGTEGDIYVVDYDFTRKIYELVPVARRDDGGDFPRLLGETGLFASVTEQRPAPGVLPYSVHVEPWLDGATAQRWIGIPGEAQIDVTDLEGTATWTFPSGTVLVRTLSLPFSEEPFSEDTAADNTLVEKPVETQIAHFEDSTWRFYTYAWRDDQSDAELVDAIGGERHFSPPPGSAAPGRTWRYSGRGECRMCHNAQIESVLGFNALQLAQPRRGDGAGAHTSELERLEAAGILNIPATERPKPPRMAQPDDKDAVLDAHMAAYFHANCACCHDPRGDATIQVFFRQQDTPDSMRALRSPSLGNFGILEARILEPGDPYRSIVLYRIAKSGYAHMPYIGSDAIDSGGVRLMHDWIVRQGPEEPRLAYRKLLDADLVAALDTIFEASSEDVAQKGPEIDAAISHVVQSTGASLALVHRMHGGEIAESVQARILELVAECKTADITGLFDCFIPSSARRVTLGARFDPKLVLQLEGSVERGKRLFESDRVACRRCHHIEKEKSFGPDLKDMVSVYTRSGLLHQTTHPSEQIRPGFDGYLVTTSAGELHAGLLVEQNEAEVIVQLADKTTVRIPAEDVLQMAKQKKSLMPEATLRDVTAQEAADLLSYLLSFR